MDYKVPDKFIRFPYGWNKKYNFDIEAEQLMKQLDNAQKENDIQKYIKDNEKWFIPASIFENYDFGHHEAYIVPEQPLGSEYRVDYMLLGRNSIGHHLVFVEFENVNVDFKIKSQNEVTNDVRKGLAQIRDWKIWIDKNKSYFMESSGLGEIGRNIPSWGIRYCLVVGRRHLMSNEANELRRILHNENRDVDIITYDRLVDNIKRLCNGF